MPLLIGLDIGTSTIKAALYDPHTGRVLRTAARPTPTHHPQPGWSEHDPEALWQATAVCLKECAVGQPAAALAISSMAEAGLLVDAAGQPLGPVIAWYDRRSEPQAARIEREVPAGTLYRITGQKVSPSFGATKLLWMREHHPDEFARAARWLPVPAWILYRLCGQMAVDRTIAARTLLFSQPALDWSEELLARLGFSKTLFPPVFCAGTAVGTLTRQAAEATGLPPSTVCVLGGHDHLCAAFACGAGAPGVIVDSSGSANALLAVVPRFLDDPALGERGYASYAALLPGQYALKGGLKAAGSALDWLAKLLTGGVPDGGTPLSAAPDFATLEAAARAGVGRKAGPLWLPHFIGSGTPEGDRFSRAALVGAQIEDTRGDLFRGLLEGLALWTRHNLEAVRALAGQPAETVALTGGAARIALLSELKAAAANRPVSVPDLPEAAATGAALLAGTGAGLFPDPQSALASLRCGVAVYPPDPTLAAWYETLYQTIYLPLYTALAPVNDALRRMESGETDRGKLPGERP